MIARESKTGRYARTPAIRRATSRLLREPLLHFFVIAAAMFAVHAWRSPAVPALDANATIPLTAEHLDWLTQTWQRQWGRAPSDEERRGLVAELLKQELLAREARELGLDVSDMIIDRRLAQKMTFLLEDAASAGDASDDELRAYFAEHADEFRSPGRVSFEQVFFNVEQRGGRVTSDIDDARRALAAGQPAATIGDRLLMDFDTTDVDETGVAAMYGPDFAKGLFQAQGGDWQGPIRSGFGLHLVRILSRTDGRPLSFDEAREPVREAWRREHGERQFRQYLASLEHKYQVRADESLHPLLPRWEQ